MPSTKVVVNFADKPSYDVRVGAGILQGIGQRVRATCPQAHQALVITDSNVAPLYLDAAVSSLKAEGLRTSSITIPAGEESKSVTCLSEIWQAMAQRGLDRSACVVALGGGVVGDLAGFAAATYMRGIGFVQAPTSLLAMVDSSVGGKTAIDLPAGKNLAGAFYQPAYVCADTSTLATLNQREWACGCGEIAKSAVIGGDDFFFWLVENASRLAERDPEVVNEAIVRSVVFKADVVAADEQERSGTRECLNYGHTLGHAIEKLAGYGVYSHGAAVAEGMRFALRLGVALADAPIDLVHEQDALLDSLGLEPLAFSASPSQIIDAMRSDKKNRDGQIRFVIPSDVGAWSVLPVEEDILREHLDAWSRSK
ncbi:3-dehydroquinate synthase [Denitrobacterium detoxificans]|uniref:3-dehydroquinate synthase n=1 Tax=Denitrobacterium detoxificans TaxID=79604 RepID=A0A172RXE1_9ACTN|nr:3-dehydroquinate synthase [Denitrobacterium detoxificans]ANE22377.1 3-dehydroquinate synthase [Denitrobacterium detoxificans]SEO93889.1 3-dehydroquinate synthase [Denitrobacterium detoxificans]